MTDSNDRGKKKQRTFLGKILIPSLKLKDVDPRTRIPKNRLTIQDAWNALKGPIPNTCPNCQAPRSMFLQNVTHDANDCTTFELGCDHCWYTENIEMGLDAVKKTIDSLRISIRRLMIGFACILGFGILFYFRTGNLLTLIGAALVATIFLLNIVYYRYRAWQFTHKRLFETKPPLFDWIRYETGTAQPKQDLSDE